MGWSLGFDETWDRDIGYGVPAQCDYPGCGSEIDRGLSYVCGGEPYGGESGCGLFFCGEHLQGFQPSLCKRCQEEADPFEPTPDVKQWTDHKATHPSWAVWRLEQAETRPPTRSVP